MYRGRCIKKMNKTTQLGFTLIDVMIGISIMALMTMIAVPSFTTLIQDRQQFARLSEFQSALQLARSEAIKRGSRTVVCASSDGAACATTAWSSGWLVYVDDDSDGVKDASETLLAVADSLDNGYSLIGSTNIADMVRYNGNGDAIELSLIHI